MIKSIFGLIGLVFVLNAADVYTTFNVEAQKSANLAFDASGVVQKVNSDISNAVKKGDILASLGNADKQATLDIARTAMKYAKKDYDRQVKVRKLIDSAKFDASEFKYENAKNQYAYSLAMYNKTVLKAPFDGVIFFKNIEVGDTVSGMMLKTVYKIQSIRERKLVISFDQKYHKSVKVGQKFKYSIDGDDKIYEGVISKIYPFANSGNRKIKAEVLAENFVVGLFGEGYINIPESK